MTATATRITCDACGRDLTDPDEQRTGMCTDDLARWFAETVIDIPNRLHPTSHDINRIVAKHAAIGSAMRALHPTDAAREAAHGYSVEHELSQVGPEPSDLLLDPDDDDQAVS